MTDDMVYDVAVIGGGLAGLSLAIQCADEGYKTVLFEKEIYPFHKVCGEYISMESFPFLERLGVPLNDYHLPPLNTLNISDASGGLYAFPLKMGGFGVSRYLLDNTLCKIAVQKGVIIHTQTKVQDVQFKEEYFGITASAGNFVARVACGAYGKRSNLDVKWKRPFILQKGNSLNNYIGVKYHIRYPQDQHTIALHNFADGYCGISRIEEDKCCLCYLTTAANLKKYGNSIALMEQQLLSQNKYLKKIFSEARFLYEQPLVISQISFQQKAQVENGILMLGDTAGLITPLCGNGMSMAMHSSVLAFNAISAYLQNMISRDRMELHYSTAWKRQFSKRLFAGRIIQRVFGGNTTTALFLKTMHHVPWLATKIIQATHGSVF